MTANRYDRAAEATIMNTYVPIDFGNLYLIGMALKAVVDLAAEQLNAQLLKFGEFRSPSAIDTENYYKETFGKMSPYLDRITLDPDALKDASFRAQLQQGIRGLDYRKLGMLKESSDFLRQGILQRAKMEAEGTYNENWDQSDISNYDTLNNGIFSDITPIRYMTANELSNAYFDNLEASSLGSVWKDGVKYNRSGITMDTLKGIAEARFNDLVSTPQGRMYYRDLLRANGGDEDAARNTFIGMIADSQRDRLVNKDTVDPVWLQRSLQNLKNQTRNQTENKPVLGRIPTRHERMQYDLAMAAQRAYGNPVDKESATVMEQSFMEANKLEQQANAKMEEYNRTQNPETYGEAVRLSNLAKGLIKSAYDLNRARLIRLTFKTTTGFDLTENPEDAEGYSREGYIRGVKAALNKLSTDLTTDDNDALMKKLRGTSHEHTLSNGFKQTAWTFDGTSDLVLPEELFALSTGTNTTKAYDPDMVTDDEIKFKEALAANSFGAVEFVPDTRNGLIAVEGGMAVSGKVRIPRGTVEDVFGREIFGLGKARGYKKDLGMRETEYITEDGEKEYYDFPVYKVLPRDFSSQYWHDVDMSSNNTNTYGGVGSATLMNDNAYGVYETILNNADE